MAPTTYTAKTTPHAAPARPRLPSDVAASLLRTCLGASLHDTGCVSVPTLNIPSGQNLYIGAGFRY